MNRVKEKLMKCYGIPEDILNECVFQDECTDEQLDELSLLVALKQLGLSKEERDAFLCADCAERTKILEKRRRETLDEIHEKERCICKLDVMRHELKKQEEKQ